MDIRGISCSAMVLLSLTGLLAIGGCQQSGDANSGDMVFFAQSESDLSELRAVRDAARENLDEFITVLQDPAPGQESFAVKARFTDAGPEERENAMTNIEYMWVAVTSYQDGAFHGTLDNTPSVLDQQFDKGQAVEIKRDAIEDWLYLDRGQRKGGRSVDVLLKSAAQREGSDAKPDVDLDVKPDVDASPDAG